MWQAPIILAEGGFVLDLLRQERLLEQGDEHYFVTMTNKCFNYQRLWGKCDCTPRLVVLCIICEPVCPERSGCKFVEVFGEYLKEKITLEEPSGLRRVVRFMSIG